MSSWYERVPRLNEILLTSRCHKAGGRVAVRSLQSRFDIVQRDIVTSKTLRIDEHLVLFLTASGGNHLRDARYCENTASNQRLCNRSKLQRRMAGRFERNEQNLAHDGRDGCKERSFNAGWQRSGNGVQLLSHDLTRALNILAPFELHPDDRHSDRCRGTDPANTGSAIQCRLDRKSDQRFHLGRNHSRTFDEDSDSRGAQIREHIDGHFRNAIAAPEKESRGERENDSPVME
jgi:hypothetical protein